MSCYKAIELQSPPELSWLGCASKGIHGGRPACQLHRYFLEVATSRLRRANVIGLNWYHAGSLDQNGEGSMSDAMIATIAAGRLANSLMSRPFLPLQLLEFASDDCDLARAIHSIVFPLWRFTGLRRGCWTAHTLRSSQPRSL